MIRYDDYEIMSRDKARIFFKGRFMTNTTIRAHVTKTIAFSILLLCVACGNDTDATDDSMTTPAMTTPETEDMSPEGTGDMNTEEIDMDQGEDVADADMGSPEEDMSEPLVQHCDARVETDRDGDGQVDSADFYRYDERGLIVKLEKDLDFDQQIDTEEIYTYNDDDLVIKAEVDEDLDGAIDSETTINYDTSGNEVLRRTDRDLDGSYEQVIEQTWEEGLLVERVDTQFGEAPSRTLWTYTEFGEIETIDFLSGTARQTFTTSFYDENNRLTHIEIDYYFGQPTVGMKTTRRFTYDAEGRLAKTEEYDGADMLGATYTYTYDENDNPLTETVDQGDGAPTTIKRWEYDDQDRVIRYTMSRLMPETLLFEITTTLLCEEM